MASGSLVRRTAPTPPTNSGLVRNLISWNRLFPGTNPAIADAARAAMRAISSGVRRWPKRAIWLSPLFLVVPCNLFAGRIETMSKAMIGIAAKGID